MGTNQTKMSDSYKFWKIERSSDFYKTTMFNMEKLRDEAWSDIVLKVGYRSLHAHRLVLAAHSAYFKTLFLSNFPDSKSKEIDLSSVVDDIDTLEKVINYMYCGYIDCEEEDFWEVARLASYFEMEMLMAKCQKKMSEHVTLHNCVEYYIFAHSHGYSSIDDVTNAVIESRFHDYFVFQESTLKFMPGDLKLMLDRGFFKNCGNASFLEFLGNWIVKGCTNQHVVVAREILEYLDQEIGSDFNVTAHKTPLKSLEDCCNNLESKLKSNDTNVDKGIADLFLKEFRKLVFQVLEAKEIPIDEEENVLFTLCKRKKREMLLEPDFEDRTKETSECSYLGTEKKDWYSVFDIFVFRDRSNCWYHLNTIESHATWYPDNLLPFQRKNRNCLLVDGALVFVTGKSRNAMKFDLEKNGWSSLKFKEENDQTTSDEMHFWLSDIVTKKYGKLYNIGNHFAVCSNEMYAIIVKSDLELHEERYRTVDVNGCYFIIYKADIKDGSLTEIARTSLQAFFYQVYIEDIEYYDCIRSSVLVQINEASGDMLILVYIDDDISGDLEEDFSFVVNIKDGSTHFFSAETTDQLKYLFNNLYIVEKDDCFLIVRHFDEDVRLLLSINSYRKKLFSEKAYQNLTQDLGHFYLMMNQKRQSLFMEEEVVCGTLVDTGTIQAAVNTFH